MAHVLAACLSIAVADSVNPATIAPAFYFAAGQAPFRSLLGYIAGVFGVFLVGGLVLLLGPGQALLALIPHPGAKTQHLIELSIGGGLLGLAGVLWFSRERVARRVTRSEGRLDRSSFLVGAGIAVVELPTAFPYFAAIAVIVGSGTGVSTQIGVLLAYDAVFIAPLLAILGIRLLARDRGQRWLERLRADLGERLAVVLPGVVLLAAVVLVALGAAGASSG